MRPRGSAATQQLSELFTHSTALKLANALAKPPLKLLLSYYRPTMFLLYRINRPRMEEIDATIPKYQPLQVLWHLCDYARRTILSCPIRPFTRQFLHCLIPKLIDIDSAILLIQPYKCLPVTTKNFTRQSFFLLSFSSHTFFGGLRELL